MLNFCIEIMPCEYIVEHAKLRCQALYYMSHSGKRGMSKQEDYKGNLQIYPDLNCT